jgi:hypothetical protein
MILTQRCKPLPRIETFGSPPPFIGTTDNILISLTCLTSATVMDMVSTFHYGRFLSKTISASKCHLMKQFTWASFRSARRHMLITATKSWFSAFTMRTRRTVSHCHDGLNSNLANRYSTSSPIQSTTTISWTKHSQAFRFWLLDPTQTVKL